MGAVCITFANSNLQDNFPTHFHISAVNKIDLQDSSTMQSIH